MGEVRSRSTVTFNEEGDYVPAAVCRLDGGLGRSGIITPPWNEEICCFLAGKGVLGSSVPVSRFAIPGGKPSYINIPLPNPSRGGVLSSKLPKKDFITIRGLSWCPGRP